MADNLKNPEFYVELDVGNLCVLNVTQLKNPIGRTLSEAALKHVAANGAQQLLNQIFKLPGEYHEHVPVAKLPEPTTIIPRQKHVPKEKPMTKWEKFSKAKGIKKRKKDSLVWDEESKAWKPQYGYRGIRNHSDDWVMEVPENADPYTDCFAKAMDEKKERVAKNEYSRLRNIASASKLKVTSLESVDRANKEQLSRSLTAAKAATASVGRFTDRLAKEKPPKNSMKKALFKPNNPKNLKAEKENNLKIFENLGKKIPKLNVEEAVQRYIAKPMKDSKSDGNEGGGKNTRRAKKNKFVKNLYRGGKKPKAFRR